MSYPCDQCDQLFDSNFRLYSHKADTHLPTVGIINKNDDENRGSKRPPSSDEPGEQPPCKTPRIEKHGVKRKKPSTFNHSSNSKRRTYQVDVSKSRGNRSIDENDQVRKIIKKGVKRLRGSDDENQHIAPRQKSRRLSPRRFKRSRISDSDSDGGSNGHVNKYRKVESRGTKRIRSLDDNSDIAPKKNGGEISQVMTTLYLMLVALYLTLVALYLTLVALCLMLATLYLMLSALR